MTSSSASPAKLPAWLITTSAPPSPPGRSRPPPSASSCRRAGQARRLRGHQGRHQVHQRQVIPPPPGAPSSQQGHKGSSKSRPPFQSLSCHHIVLPLEVPHTSHLHWVSRFVLAIRIPASLLDPIYCGIPDCSIWRISFCLLVDPETTRIVDPRTEGRDLSPLAISVPFFHKCS
ncbi:unnamed protein product [Staurois parvus]|uniref:Uncharacterized protein n=1 Tax=Staurois parvus TaxID=386267 RepID=A0ABN9HVN6_9NEOB|nr:unnamed protein product [Staurois parvus]